MCGTDRERRRCAGVRYRFVIVGKPSLGGTLKVTLGAVLVAGADTGGVKSMAQRLPRRIKSNGRVLSG